MNRASVSVFIVCCNEEAQIERCLKSVKWCDEIIVVDSGSTDRTLEICRAYSNRIFSRAWPGFVEQKRFGLQQCSSDWVLNIDADEEVSEELRTEILEILKRGSPPSDGVYGYFLSRVVFHLGRWWRKGGWYPEYRLRFCYRERTSWGGNDPHEKAIVEGMTKRLKGELRHYTYSDLHDQVQSLNSLSSAAARNSSERGHSGSVWRIFVHPPLRFLKFYIAKKGYREGGPGLVVAALEAGYVFLKYAKIWELRLRERTPGTESDSPGGPAL